MYIAQTLLIASTLYLLLRRQYLVLRLQIIGWAIGVTGIWWRYGEGQDGFYSNDQIHYASVVRILVRETWPRTIDWWLDFSKIPYPAAAVPLSLIGVHAHLALKTVSLLCLLALSYQLLQRVGEARLSGQLKVLYLTGCGLIGSFFSLLALRETMMMFFVYRYATDRSLAGRLFSLVILFLLRSHLAAAILLAELALACWKWLTERRRLGYFEAPALIILGVTLGTMLFTWRFATINNDDVLSRIRTPFSGDFGIKETLQVASNFAGLQFLTAHEAFVKLSVTDLLLLRVIFSDTVLIPFGFTFAFVLLGPRLTERHKFALLAFCIYVSIVTNTDFNSFRQNIPLMPLMGLIIVDALRELRPARSTVRSPQTNVGKSTANVEAVSNTAGLPHTTAVRSS